MAARPPASAPPPAAGQPPARPPAAGPPAGGAMGAVDANKDGKISEQEARAFLNQLKAKNPAAYQGLEEMAKKTHGGRVPGSALEIIQPLLDKAASSGARSAPSGGPPPGQASAASAHPPSAGRPPAGGASAASAGSAHDPRTAGGGGPNTQCPKNYQHQMLVRAIPTAWSCNGCGRNGQPNEPHLRCDADDLDFCSSCRPPQGGGGAGGGPVYDPRGHAMEVRQINTVYNCDRCGQQRAVGEPHMRCDACNTDYCVNCAPLPGGGGNWNQGGNNWNQGGGNNWNQGGGNNWNQGGNQGGGGVHPNPNPPPGMGGGNNWNQGGGSNWNQGGGGWNQGVGPFGLHAEGSSFKDNKQHTLTHSAVQAAYLCNMCNVQQGPSGRNYRCKTCGTAFCENCVNGVKNQGNWNQGGNNWNQGGNQGGGLAGLLDQLLNGGSLGNIFG